MYIDFNINHDVKVKLTPIGEAVLAKYWGGTIPEWYASYTDKDGWIQFQLHTLMNIFGDSCVMGRAVPFETNIKINIEDGYAEYMEQKGKE